MESCVSPDWKTTGNAIVMGMSRSGSSLTTSIVASVFGPGPEVWRGGGKEYPPDENNPRGYFERKDVIALNYQTISAAGERWWVFPSGFASAPRALMNATTRGLPAAGTFRMRAAPIIADMNAHASAQRNPWVLKDVRFARTLPLWRPLLSERLVCLIPIRHPSEVAASSRMSMTDRMMLWQNYMLAALATARSLRCPTMLIAYERWMLNNSTSAGTVTGGVGGGAGSGGSGVGSGHLERSAADDQLATLVHFMRCAGLRVPSDPPYAKLRQLIQPSQYHKRVDLSQVSPKLPVSVACLWEELRSARALHWNWDEKAGRFKQPPCVGGRRPWTQLLQQAVHYSF